MDIVIATKNKHKIEEILQALGELPVNFISLDKLEDIPEVEEDGLTFHANAVKKASVIAKATKRWTIADDSGLEIEYLDGRPGIFSSRYAESNEKRINKVLTEMKNAEDDQRDAQFVCCACLSDPKGNTITRSGICKGYIIKAPKGHSGFGYDPIFYVDILSKTMAELAINEKNHISHRGIAMNKIKPLISQIAATKAKTIEDIKTD